MLCVQGVKGTHNMNAMQAVAALALVVGCVAGSAQQTTQVQLKIEPTNRTLTVSAEERVTADPDLAILPIRAWSRTIQ